MVLKLLHDWDTYKSGQVVDVKDELGHIMIGSGCASVEEIQKPPAKSAAKAKTDK